MQILKFREKIFKFCMKIFKILWKIQIFYKFFSTLAKNSKKNLKEIQKEI